MRARGALYGEDVREVLTAKSKLWQAIERIIPMEKAKGNKRLEDRHSF